MHMERITHNRGVMGGKPCIRGLRVPVGTIRGLLASGESRERILQAYPYLEPEDIDAALAYAAWDSTEGPDLERQLQIPRRIATKLGAEAVQIINAGYYTSVSGKIISIVDRVEHSVRNTVSYPPEESLPTSVHGPFTTTVVVRNETTLSGVSCLRSEGHEPTALNFASATSPGGGFLSGARAQEEYLARSSSLYACLRSNPMYTKHTERLDPFYTDYVIYSPGVVVFRSDDGELLDEPYACSIITCPAVHASGVNRYQPTRRNEIPAAMWSRILKILSVAARHDHRTLVLGAWGCGAFGNDGAQIAHLFHKALQENFRGAFEHVTFSITDWSPDRRFIEPFEREFGVFHQ